MSLGTRLKKCRVDAFSGQQGSLLDRQPLLICHRLQLCLIWHVSAWHVLLQTCAASVILLR